ANGCQGNPFTVTLTINPEPVVANQTSTICSDINSGLLLNLSSSVFAASYTISNINSNGLTPYAGNPQTGTGFLNDVIVDDAWTNTTSAAVDVIYTIIPVSADNCQGDAFTVILTINPEPEITNQIATICSNSSVGINLNLSTSVNATSFNILSINSNGLIASAGNPIFRTNS
uniref:PKD-like domain-containing protein n=1 Tax=Flavobacterium sp. TaxID=239 RepID=UPI00404AE4D5